MNGTCTGYCISRTESTGGRHIEWAISYRIYLKSSLKKSQGTITKESITFLRKEFQTITCKDIFTAIFQLPCIYLKLTQGVEYVQN